MSRGLFPSGPWTGFFTYEPDNRHPMDLRLEFGAGRVRGDGRDEVGEFVILGRYDVDTRECDWLKTYPGSHSVFYQGYREGKGIWGRWDIGLFGHGGFHIWPVGAEGETVSADRTQADSGVERGLGLVTPGGVGRPVA